MHLFLKGPRGIGKSTLLRKMLLPYQNQLAGFMVQRLFEDKTPVGFRAVLLNGCLPPLETEYSPDMDGVFILRGQKDVAVLDRIIVMAEASSQQVGCNMLLLDEIGGIELTSPVFMAALLRILSGSKPCIGVLKSAENLAHMATMLHLENEYLGLRATLEKSIERSGRIVEFDAGDKDGTISRWVRCYVD